MFAAPKFTLIDAMPKRPLNVTHMEMVVHIGTHVDAPRHFCIDGPTMEAIPLDRLKGSRRGDPHRETVLRHGRAH
jgi:kynurenine formamidase